ncbi:ras-like protein family member 11B isoform X3 [Alligator mississippiensis]|uniref:ras-like protein family member 11B isoform X3 n=1 Tax=Alligator mississippiensis TaxID=8496 RepID=UPI002877D9AF|nr:ras-like protein family member 11B isoform X3 [Alligator mississippiensis]
MRLIQSMCTIAECPPDCCPAARPRLVKIAVLGASGVGKTGNLYSRQIQLDGETLAIQVQDTPGIQIHEHTPDCNEQLNRCIRWADAVVIVFSITDYKSYELLSYLHQHIRQLHPGNTIPVVIVANKADLLHIKEVEPQHGLQLANVLGCAFYEVSVSENYNDVFNAFHVLCKEVSKQQITSTPERRRTSLIPRPKSPNMQDLKRRFKQALSAKVRTVTSV